MAIFREILTRIGFTVDKGKIKASEVEVARFKKQMSLAAREARRMRSNLNTALSAAKAMTVAVVGSRAAQALTTAYSGPIDALAKFSTAIGVNVEDLQGWAYGAELSGVKVEDLKTGLRTLAANMGAATKAGSEQAKTFGSIGISATDAKGQVKGEAAMLAELADKFAASEDGADKAAIAQKLFGDAGVKMIPFLNQGSKGIASMTAEAKRLGIVMNSTQTKEAQAFNVSMIRLKAAAAGVRNQIAAALLPTLTALATRFTEWASQSGNMAALMATLATAAKIAGAALAWMAAQKIAAGLSAIGGAARAAASSLRIMGIAGAFAQVKMGLLIGAFALIGAAVYDMYRITQGQDSFLLKFLGDGKEADAIKAALSGVLATLSEIWTEIKPAVIALGMALMEAFQALWKAIKPILPYLIKYIMFVIKVMATWIGWLIKGLAFVLKWAAKAIAWLAGYIGPLIAWIKRAWEAAGEAASSAWEGLKSVFDTIYAAGKWIATTLGDAFKWAADVAAKAWNALIAPFVWLYDKMVAMYDLVIKVKEKVGFKALLGFGNFAGGMAEVAAESEKRKRMAATAPSDNSVKVQSLNVNVTGAPNMTPAELTLRIRDGVANGLQSIIDQAYANRAEAVP